MTEMTRELTRRIAVTIGALLLFRLGAFFPLPGIDIANWQQIFANQHGGLLGIVNRSAGGGVQRMAIFSLGILPYLSTATFIQLASLVSGRVRSGEAGRRRIARLTLALTLVIAPLQGVGIAIGLQHMGGVVTNPGSWFVLSTTAMLVAGVFLQIWLAEQITRHGIGNGLALFLSVNLVVQLPADIASLFEMSRMSSSHLPLFTLAMTVVVTAFVVFVEGARRNIHVEFAERRFGTRILPAQSAVLPIKINNAGFLVPATVASLVSLLLLVGSFVFGPAAAILSAGPTAWILGAIAIFGFAFIYTAYVIDPDHAAESLRKHGGVIAGVEPGEPTARHIDRAVSMMTVLGAPYLTVMWLMPGILRVFEVPFFFSGGSLLIVVCTVLDIRTQVQHFSRNKRGGIEIKSRPVGASVHTTKG